MKTNLLNSLTRNIHKVGHVLQKHSPEILVVAGVVGTVASTVMACKATTKLSTILDETKEHVELIHQTANDEKFADKYSEEDAKKDLLIEYTQSSIKVAKLYAPSVILGTLSIASILMSHRILSRRNVALASAFTAVSKGFKDYRGRVVERFGERIDRELRYNLKAEEIERTVVNEDGTESTVRETIEVADFNPSEYSEYARFFDELNPYWEKDAEYNLMFLNKQQAHANDLLRIKGRLFLNDVYKMIGIEPTKAGQVMGWVYDEKNPVGDNYIDFGIYDTHKKGSREFVNGYEKAILLDFNVDGNIWDMM